MRGPIAFAGLCLLAASAVAGERPVVFTSPAPGDALQSGAVVQVSWTGVPPNANEVELLLSLDGGGRIALRLTKELSSDDRSYLWRVPNLSSRRAAFVLRMGIEGREVESASSAPFEILPDPSRPVESVDWRAGELWLIEESRARDADPLPAAGLESRPERWAPFRERSDSIAPEETAVSCSRPSGRFVPVPREPSRGDPRQIPVSRLPLPAPLRI
jgi:hypothetical protein